MSFNSGRANYPLTRLFRGGCMPLLFLLLCFTIGAFPVWLFVLPDWQARLFGMQTQGTVTSLAACPEGGAGDAALRSVPLVEIVDHVTPTIQFTDRQGQTHVVRNGSCGSYGIGEQVTLWYVPDSPTTIFLEKEMGSLIAFTILGAWPIAAALLYMLWLVGRNLRAVVGARAAWPS